MSKRSKSGSQSKKSEINFRRKLLWIPGIALAFKLILIARIEAIPWPAVDPNLYRLANFWMGADGENYVTGLNALFRDGLFSAEGILNYWPAGYPILLLLMSFSIQSLALVNAAVIQTLIYAVAAAYFVDKLTSTRIRSAAVLVAIIINFNPTLSFNSYSIGYESFTAALVLIAWGLLIAEFQKNSSRWISKESVIAALLLSLSSFMQPRMVVTSFVLFLFWGLVTRTRVVALAFIAATMALSLVFPALLIARNYVASDQLSISTNLGVTMKIGAGDGASGGYLTEGSPLKCLEVSGTAAEVDNATVRCVIEWYLENPEKVPALFARKVVYFWSPWFGPVANGTMARNPWAQNHPLQSTLQSEGGFNLVYGGFGKFISYLWLLTTLIFMGLGFWVLWRMNGLERLIGLSALGAILINMAVSMATIGDHRFRLPIAGLILFLQGVGLIWAFSKKERRSMGRGEPLLWKSFTKPTNLET